MVVLRLIRVSFRPNGKARQDNGAARLGFTNPAGKRPLAAAASQGLHSEHLGPLLAEMQYLQRSHPGLQRGGRGDYATSCRYRPGEVRTTWGLSAIPIRKCRYCTITDLAVRSSRAPWRRLGDWLYPGPRFRLRPATSICWGDRAVSERAWFSAAYISSLQLDPPWTTGTG